MASLTSSPSPIHWPSIYAIVHASFERGQYCFFTDSDSRVAGTLALMNVGLGLRDYAIVGAVDIQPVWEVLRKDPSTMDLLFSVTSDVLLESGHTIAQLADALATAIHATVPRIADGSVNLTDTVYDVPFAESVGSAVEMRQVLVLHPWLLTLLLLKRSGRMNLVRPTASATAAE